MGQKLQDEVQDVEELGRGSLLGRRERRDEINRGRGLGWGLIEERRERLHLVAGLDLFHIKETMVKDQVDIVKQARKYLPTVERVPESRRR